MQITQESSRSRRGGLLIVWLITGSLLFLHAAAVRRYLGLLDNVGLRGAAVSPTPMQHVVPTMYADAQMWVRHAIALAHGAGPQLRYTHVDNAPTGREVHWSSGFAWLIAGEGLLCRAMTGGTLPHAIERVLPWFNAPLLLAFIAIFSIWISRRAGLGAGVLVAFGMIGSDEFYSGFSPDYADHHGILAAVVLGLVLGAVCMGAGLWSAANGTGQLLPAAPRQARDAAVFSAICGGVGMWVSAATLIPAIVIVALAGSVTLVLFHRRAGKGGIDIEPGVWRTWSRTGALVSFAFYLLEYAPHHLGFRLEVNHPAYAVAWWGGGEVVAQFAEWLKSRAGRAGIGRRRARGSESGRGSGKSVATPPRIQSADAGDEGAGFRPNVARLAMAIAGLAAAPVIIAIGGARVFVVFDPFITRLSKHVAEGIPLSMAVHIWGWSHFTSEFVWIGTSLVLGGLALWRARPTDRPAVVFTFLAVLAFTGMALAQIRWSASAGGPQIVLVLVAVAACAASWPLRLRWAAVAVIVGAWCMPFAIGRVVAQYRNVGRRTIDQSDAIQPVYRDIAAALRRSQPAGRIILLASPNASAAVGYYGRFETIGTLYWENLDGTKAAAEMFSASTDQARRRIRTRGVTHVALVSRDNFLAEYFDLLHPGADRAQLEKSFGYQLLVNVSMPLWLEQIPYACPPDAVAPPKRVFLFRTKFGDPRAETLYEDALVDYGAKRTAQAEAKLNEALGIEPGSAEFWVAKANLLLDRNDLGGAVAAVRNAVAHADPGQMFAVCSAEGGRFYGRHAEAVAAALFRRAISVRSDPVTINNLAWLLATSADAHVRNGPEALKLSEALVAKYPQLDYLNAYAAALAACGRFGDAVSAGERAVRLAEASGNPRSIGPARYRLEQYRNGRAVQE